MSWIDKFIGLCEHIASWSKDPSTQVGAVVANGRNKILSIGYNGFPIGVRDDIPQRFDRPQKYQWTEHAERNAIYSAAEEGISLKGSTLYCNYFPCSDCMRAVIQSGIIEIVYFEEKTNGASSEVDIDQQISRKMAQEAGVNIYKYEKTQKKTKAILN